VGAADVALGNVVGSNIFNVRFILGLSALIAPLIVSRQLVRLDVPLMIGVSLLVWLLAAGTSRPEVAAYTIYLALHAAEHPVLDEFRVAMLGFALPLTALTVLVLGAQARRRE